MSQTNDGAAREMVPASPLLKTALMQLLEMYRQDVTAIVQQGAELEGKSPADGWQFDQQAHCWTRPKPNGGRNDAEVQPV